MNTETIDFIRLHANDDVRQLAFLADKHPLVDMTFALQQIAGRQQCRQKLPRWSSIEDLYYPPHLSLEQCSSEQTAQYKASLLRRLLTTINAEVVKTHLGDKPSEPHSSFTLVDLTGGFGVDLSFFAQEDLRSTYVELLPHLCDIARHNFPLLGMNDTQVVCADGVDYLHKLDSSTIIYLDPARRNSQGGRTVDIADCVPNILDLKEELIDKSVYTLVKLSPMLDWHQAVKAFNHTDDIVREIHIVSVKNECKELLFVLSKVHQDPLTVYCINDDDVLVFRPQIDEQLPMKPMFCEHIHAGMYLYEPNASVMKAGCFQTVCHDYPVRKVSVNSHLFVSDDLIVTFPGRKFQIIAISSMNKKELKAALGAIHQANITVRNFPMTVAELRKRLKLKEGGSVYLFATTDQANNHLLLVCQKAITHI